MERSTRPFARQHGAFAGVALAVSGVGSRAISQRGDYLVEAYR